MSPRNGALLFLYICFMIKIGEVFNIVRDLANKDQKGFVTPAVFNTFAGLAQLNVYDKIFNEFLKAKTLRRSGVDGGRDKSYLQQIEEDLSRYIEEITIQEVYEQGLVGEDENGNMTEQPIDLDEYASLTRTARIKKIISIRIDDSSRKEMEVVYSPDKIHRILDSNLSAPTDDFPIAFVKGQEIQIFPDTIAIESCPVMFYRYPRSVKQNGSIDTSNQPTYSILSYANGGVEIENTAASRNFDLPERYKDDLVLEMSKLIGIRLRDSFMGNAVNIEESKQ